MLGTRRAFAEIDTATAPAFGADSRRSVDSSDVAVTDSAGYRALVTALVASYPDWTDENGTNIEQLAAIAVAALEQAGMNRRVES